MDLKEDGLVNPEAHWYYVSKAHAIKTAVARFAPKAETLIDVGAGSGFFAKRLLSGSGLALRAAICVDTKYAESSTDGAITYRRTLPDTSADLLLLLDVLEHVSDDRALLKSSLQRLSSGGIAVISVPAFMSLWSSHDDYLEHFRRYRLKEVVQLADECGLAVLEQRYLFGALFPVAYLVRRLLRRKDAPAASDLRPTHPALDRFLRFWFRLEGTLFRQRMFGLTALVVGSMRSPEAESPIRSE